MRGGGKHGLLLFRAPSLLGQTRKTSLALAGVLVCRLVMVSAGVVAQALACVGHLFQRTSISPWEDRGELGRH